MSTQQTVIIVAIVAVIIALLAMRSGGPRVTIIKEDKVEDDDA